MNANTRVSLAAGSVLVGLATFAAAAPAGGVSAHSARASEHFSAAAAHSVTASGKLIAGALAIGLEIPASVGKVSGAAADDLWRAADRETDLGLPIDDAVHTVGPPPDRAIERDPIARPGDAIAR